MTSEGIFILIIYEIALFMNECKILIICGVIAAISIFGFRRYGKRHKRKVLEKLGLTGAVLSAIAGVLSFIIFPTAFPYVDTWVLGKTKEEIIAVYGEPSYDDHDQHKIAYYTRYIMMDPEYYVITFDKDGCAIEVKEGLFVPTGG